MEKIVCEYKYLKNEFKKSLFFQSILKHLNLM